MRRCSCRFRAVALAMACILAVSGSSALWADGMLLRLARYKGLLLENAQEAIIIFNSAPPRNEATEDLILKIRVEGEAARFAWVVPFPNQPEVTKADAALFKELHDYVSYRNKPVKSEGKMGKFGGGMGGMAVDVLSREVVGSYDVAVVRENEPGTLNKWLEDEGYQRLVNGDDVIEFYRKKGYAFSCIKVAEANLKTGTPVDLHPLQFTFKTGGRDGIYFPMKMSGLQEKPFDVNLYVFYQWWLNDHLNRYGYEHRGFHRAYRDWDGPRCKPNAGKDWGRPGNDPFLNDAAGKIRTVAELFRKLHPKDRYYLTNLDAYRLKPEEVRKWPDDLWLFPYYVDKERVPFDAKPGGSAEAAYAH